MKANKKVLAIVAVIALVAILGICLVACNADSYVKKLQKLEYNVAKVTAEDVAKYGVKSEDVEWTVSARQKLDFVFIIKFKDGNNAKKFVEDFQNSLVDCDRSGSIVFIGSEEAIADAK